MRLSITKTYNLLACMGQYSLQIKNGQTWGSWGKVDDRISILQLEPGAKNKTKPRYESRKMI